MKIYGWLKAIITIMAAMAFSIAILLSGTACKGAIQAAGLDGLPKEPGTYIDIGYGWQGLEESQFADMHSGWGYGYPSYQGIAISNEDMEKIGLVIKPGTKGIKLGWRMAPSELSFAQNPLMVSAKGVKTAHLYPLTEGKGNKEAGYQQTGTGFNDVGMTYVPINGWEKDSQDIAPTELSVSDPAKGFQLVELALTDAKAFELYLHDGAIFLHF